MHVGDYDAELIFMKYFATLINNFAQPAFGLQAKYFLTFSRVVMIIDTLLCVQETLVATKRSQMNLPH